MPAGDRFSAAAIRKGTCMSTNAGIRKVVQALAVLGLFLGFVSIPGAGTAVAAPQFRADLEEFAIEAKLLCADRATVGTR